LPPASIFHLARAHGMENSTGDGILLNMRRGPKAFTLIEIMIAITIIAILAAILVPNFKRARIKSQLSTCVTNCKNLSTVLEMYAVDNSGRFPNLGGLPGIDMLIAGNYMKRRPSCPTTQTCTFVDYSSSVTPDSFSFSCVGNNHGDLFFGLPGTNIPYASYGTGVVDQP